MKRRAITAEKATAVGPYSHGVRAGNLVFLSGQTPVDSDTGNLLEGTIGEQTHQCFKNLQAVLEAADLSFDNVVKVNVFLTDMHTFSEMNEAYKSYFTEPYPARTTIGVASLPLFASVEIEMIAER